MIKAPQSLLENTITVLAFDDDKGRIISNMVTAKLFEGQYRLIAERILSFWQQYRVAPKAHLPDLFEDIFDRGSSSESDELRITLSKMRELSKEVNAGYVVNQLTKLVRLQTLKLEILKSAEVLQRGGDSTIEEVEALLSNLLRSRQVAFDPGLSLEDISAVLAYLRFTQEDEIPLGIEPLDRHRIALRRGELTTLISPAKVGKSWFLVHCGRQAINRRKKVVHISLELAPEEVMLRYFMGFFAVPKRAGEVLLTELLIRGDRLDSLDTKKVDYDFPLDSSGGFDTAQELRTRVNLLGKKSNYLRVKRFPMRYLTLDLLDAYLDMLEQDGFVPDLLIIDYPQLMKINTENFRIGLGHTIEGIRGILVERNCAGVIVHQSSKAGDSAAMVQAGHVAEDWSVVMTSDNVLTLSRSESEQALGLGRIFVDRARAEVGKFMALLTMNFTIGQFCMQAFQMPNNYNRYLADLGDQAETDHLGGENQDD